jgi:hypothetical protein
VKKALISLKACLFSYYFVFLRNESTRNRTVARSAERIRVKRVIFRALNKPETGRRTKDGDVRFAVTAVISGYDDVASVAKIINVKSIVRASGIPPTAVRWSEDADVCF